MKKFLLVFAVFVLSLQVSGQTDTTILFSKDDYLQKSTRQKKAGYTLLGIGGGLMLTAFMIPRGEKIQDGICIPFAWCTGDEYKNDELKGMVGTVGAVTALSSIFFFNAAKKNARRAATAGLHMEKAPQLIKGNIVQHSFPALRIRWCF
jgi:hypothetical protein